MLMKEIEEHLSKRRHSNEFMELSQHIVKMSVLPQLIHGSNANLVKNPAVFLVATDEFILKFIWKGTCPRGTKIPLK